MDKTMAPLEAWADFYGWAKKQSFWKRLPKKEKRRLYDAQADYSETRGQSLGGARIRSILEQYAPDRYTFTETITLHE